MHAVQVRKPAPPESHLVEEVPGLDPVPGQALIANHGRSHARTLHLPLFGNVARCGPRLCKHCLCVTLHRHFISLKRGARPVVSCSR